MYNQLYFHIYQKQKKLNGLIHTCIRNQHRLIQTNEINQRKCSLVKLALSSHTCTPACSKHNKLKPKFVQA